MGCFATADGHVNVAALDGRLWLRASARVLGLPELLDDPRFATVDAAPDHRAELNALVAARLRTAHDGGVGRRPGRRRRAGGAGQRRRTRSSPTRRSSTSAMVQPVEHPEMGELRLLGNAVDVAGLPRTSCAPRAPAAGEHNDEILAELGLGDRDRAPSRAGRRSDAPSTCRSTTTAPSPADVRPRRAAQRVVDGDVPLAARRARAHRARPRRARRRPSRRRRRRVHVGRGHLRAGRTRRRRRPSGPGTRRWRR